MKDFAIAASSSILIVAFSVGIMLSIPYLISAGVESGILEAPSNYEIYKN